ncbi:MAG: FIST N-terminal domain-containing protein [Acidobacteriota bacterium]|nr:FIST N-terminal domain-containing protein [Acidobacteriota bacterium]
MKWHTVASGNRVIEEAVAECTASIQEALGDKPPDLLFVFLTPHYADHYERVPGLLSVALSPLHLVGCCGEGVVGGNREWEMEAAFTVTAARLPGVQIKTFHLDIAGEHDLEPGVIASKIGLPAEEGPGMVLLADPFTFPAEIFLNHLDQAYPFSQKAGGLVSGGNMPGQSFLFRDEAVYRGGLVGVGFHGNLAMDTLVSQGCRAVGSPMFITGCQDNVILELDGRSPREVLHGLYQSLDKGDRGLFSQALFIGVEMRPEVVVNDRGDFLIRNIISMDSRGRLEVAAGLVENQVIQFHLRDRKASAEDLKHQLARYHAMEKSGQPVGSLLFSCLGRGARFFGRPNHDSDLLYTHLGMMPLGGFFCNGEIGPVQGATYVHGYTSSFALFRRRTPE